MRYRVKNYEVSVTTAFLQLSFALPAGVELPTSNGNLTSAASKYILESIRLIADETRGGYIVCSTGQKGTLSEAVYRDNTLYLQFFKNRLISAADGDEDDLAAISAMTSSDQFTIEMDWGEEPGSGGGGAMEVATQQEYATFKSYMQTQIATILTPINNE